MSTDGVTAPAQAPVSDPAPARDAIAAPAQGAAPGGEPVSLGDFLAGAATFDVVLFSGAGLYARAIRALEGRALGARLAELEARDGALPSHVGVVVRGDAFAPASRYHDPARAYLFESTFGSEAVPDFDGRAFAGSQLRELGPAVAHYVAGGGAAWWAPLTAEARARCAAAVAAGFDAGGEAAARLGRPYEFSALSLAAAALACCRPCRAACGCAPARWVFCSELAAEYLAAAGAFGGAAVEPGDVVPADFLLDADGALPRVVGPPRPVAL